MLEMNAIQLHFISFNTVYDFCLLLGVYIIIYYRLYMYLVIIALPVCESSSNELLVVHDEN